MEINRSVSGISHKSLEALVDAVNREKRIFCDGVGRSRLKAEGFAMRLIQMGFTALVVGEATTPAITRRLPCWWNTRPRQKKWGRQLC